MKRFIVVIILLTVIVIGAYVALNALGIDILAGITGTADSDSPAPNDNNRPESPRDDAVETGDGRLFEPARRFAPEPDGFSFRNFSGRFKEGDLAIAEVRAMFGDAVCTRVDGDTCVPHPKVVTWIDNLNTMMNSGGHCVGFTVASNQLHNQIRSVGELGADITYDLNRKDLPVLKTISQSYASNYAGNVQATEVKDKTPAEIVEALLLLDEPVDIGIFFPTYGLNGHSVLGYDVTDVGDGVFYIWVYDSNRPGTENIIVVDTRAETWFYPDAAVNPDEASTDYKGDATTRSLTFFPLSAYDQPLACPADFAELCPATPEATRFSVVTTTGRGQVVAETADGQIGQSGETIVNTVPGGDYIPARGELYSRQSPILLIPETNAFTLRAQGAQDDADLAITVANPNYSVVIDGLIAQPGQIEQLTFDPTTQQFNFVAGGAQRPSFKLVFNRDGNVYMAQLVGLEFAPGQELTLSADAATGNLQWTSASGLVGGQATFIVARLSSGGEAVFATQAPEVPPGAGQAVDLTNWDGSGAMTFLADGDGDGSYEAGSALNNQPVATILPVMDTPTTVVATLQSVATYLDSPQRSAVATFLPLLGFSGSQLGEAYRQLPAFQLDDLAAAVADLPPREIGRFAVAANLEPAATNALLEGLQPDVRSAVETAIADQEAVIEAVDEWEFLNAVGDDGLPDFLAEQGLNEDQVGDFMTLVAPPPSLPEASTPIVATDELGDECSPGAGAANDITFVNATGVSATTIWVDFQCNEQVYRTIAPGESYTQGTFPGHPWRVRSAATGEFLPLDTPLGFVITYINDGAGGVTVIIRE